MEQEPKIDTTNLGVADAQAQVDRLEAEATELLAQIDALKQKKKSLTIQSGLLQDFIRSQQPANPIPPQKIGG